MYIHYNRKILIIFILIFLICLYFVFASLSIKSQITSYFATSNDIFCYRIRDMDTLPNVQDVEIKAGKSIFFHETSCRSYNNGKITILPRQACAIESALRLNPNFDVNVLFTSPGVLRLEEQSESDRILKSLLTYDNIQLLHVDYENYTKDTPVEHLFSGGVIEKSTYAQSHASDVLRYLTLWKYGGIYLDLDVIVIKSLEDLKWNYAGSESDDAVAAGIISLSPTGIGHKMALSCLNDLRLNFNGKGWGDNGPGVITRLAQFLCGVKKAKDMYKKDCTGFRVYPPEFFYPVPWWNWTMYFKSSDIDTVNRLAENSYLIHVWNKHSEKVKIPVSAEVPYSIYAKKYCPKVFGECKKYF